MKHKITTILTLILLSFNQIYSQELSYEAKSKAQTAISCIDNNDYYCGLINLEQLIKNHSSEMNSAQVKSIKEVLIDCYYEVSMAKGKNNDPNFKEYCIKGIQLGKEINQQYNIDAFMLHYMMIGRYYHLENETLMNKWISKFNVVRDNLDVDADLKRIMISWANSNIRKMRSFFGTSNSTTSYTFSFNDLVSNSSSKSKTTTTYEKSSTKKVVIKTEKCCTDTKLGDKVIVYYAFTNKNEKIHLYYYPHLDQWHFKNGWGEKNRGNKFYESLERIIEYIENE